MTCGDGPAVRWSQRVEALDAAGRSSRFSLPLSRGLQLDFEIHLFASFDLELLLGALATRTDHGDAVPAGLDQQPAPQGAELLAGADETAVEVDRGILGFHLQPQTALLGSGLRDLDLDALAPVTTVFPLAADAGAPVLVTAPAGPGRGPPPSRKRPCSEADSGISISMRSRRSRRSS